MATNGIYGTNGPVIPDGVGTSFGLYGEVVPSPASGGGFGDTTLFAWIESPTQPPTPTGGTFIPVDGSYTPPSGWLPAPPTNPTTFVWFSYAFYNTAVGTVSNWSTPSLWGSQSAGISVNGISNVTAENFTGNVNVSVANGIATINIPIQRSIDSDLRNDPVDNTNTAAWEDFIENDLGFLQSSILPNVLTTILNYNSDLILTNDGTSITSVRVNFQSPTFKRNLDSEIRVIADSEIRDRILPGANVSLTYDPQGRTIINASGGGGGATGINTTPVNATASGTYYLDSDGVGNVQLMYRSATVPFSAAITAVWETTGVNTIRFDAAASRVDVTLTAVGTVTGLNQVTPNPNPFGQFFFFNSPGTARSSTAATPQNISFSGSITGTDSRGGSTGSPHAVSTSVSVYYPAFAGISATIPTTWVAAQAISPEYTNNPTNVNVSGAAGEYFVLVTRGVVSRIITPLGDTTFTINADISIAGQTYHVVSVPNYGGSTQSFTITYSSPT